MRPEVEGAAERRLGPAGKAVFGLGDHTLNLTLSALSLLYLYFLTEHVGLRPGLAGSVLLVGRLVDAFTDPLMGRISDRTRLGAGRRRPYFLIGAVPFGLSFAALWFPYPVEDPSAKFAVYATAYVVYSLCSTVVSVPYVALLPEIALGYHERTSLSAWRAAGSVTGVLAAAAFFRPLVNLCGGGAQGFAWAGAICGLWVAWPWLALYAATFERPELRRSASLGFWDGIRLLAKQRSFRALVGMYLCSRIAMDVVAAMFLFYFEHCLGRPEDFEPAMVLLLVTTAASLPFWLRLARRRDKAAMFRAGVLSWAVVQGVLTLAGPDWPRALILLLPVLAGAGYAVADMMPWSMLGEVVDEDELRGGERREGIYGGVFTFVRKLGGATAVALAGWWLQWAGFDQNRSSPEALLAVRTATGAVPALFLLAALVLAARYPISQARHQEILAGLQEARASKGDEQ